MGSNSDSGHDSNVVSLQALNVAITYMGAGYNPAADLIKLTSLQAKHASAQASLYAVSIAYPIWSTKVKERYATFGLVNDRATRSVNPLEALAPQSPALPLAKHILKQLRGQRITPLKLNPDGTVAPMISMSQQSYDDKERLFKDLVNNHKTEPKYLPDDDELKLTGPEGLEAFGALLGARNSAEENAKMPLDNDRADRDEELYDPVTGVVAVGQQSKLYIKGKFGAKSPQYQQVKGLKFRNLKKKK